MFNPYFETPAPQPPSKAGGLQEKLSKLDSDDLLMLALVFILARKSNKDDMWPLIAVALYCFL